MIYLCYRHIAHGHHANAADANNPRVRDGMIALENERRVAARMTQARTLLAKGDSAGADAAQERAVDVQITRLRRKIEADPRQPRYLQTVRGEGYMLAPD